MNTQWIKTTLNSCVKLQSGGTPSKNNPDYWGGNIPWVSSKDLKSIRIYDTEDHITELAVENGAKLVPPGTILLAVRGMRLAKELPIAEVQCTASFNQDLKALHCKELINPRFLLYWLIAESHQLMGKCDEAAHGTKRLQTELLLSTQIELPPLATQQRIAEILSNYDRLIDNNNRRIALLEESIHLLYKDWFVRLRFPGYESVKVVDGVPEGWNRIDFSEALILQRGFDLPNKDRKPGDIPVYASTGINGFHDTSKVKAPGVVTGRSGTLGSVMYVQQDFWPLNTTLWVKEFKKVTPSFAYCLLSQMDLNSYQAGAAVPTLNRNVIHKIKILVPTEQLQLKFDNLANLIFSQIEVLKKYNYNLLQARDLLLPRLMNGSIAV